MHAAPEGSTPMTLMCGLSSLASVDTADGHQDVVDERQLLHDLHGDGALARGDAQVVERVDECVAVLLGKLERVFVGLVVDVAGQHHVGAQRLGALDFDERGGGGHDDGGLDAVMLGGIGDALRVVAGGCGDQTVRALLVGQRADLIVGAAHLVCAGALHVFGLEEHAVAGNLAEVGAFNKLRLLCNFLDFGCGFFECVQRQHSFTPFVFGSRRFSVGEHHSLAGATMGRFHISATKFDALPRFKAWCKVRETLPGIRTVSATSPCVSLGAERVKRCRFARKRACWGATPRKGRPS